MEIIRPDGVIVNVPGCANMGENNESDHCLKRFQCRFFGDCLAGGGKKPYEVESRAEITPGIRMDGGVPKFR